MVIYEKVNDDQIKFKDKNGLNRKAFVCVCVCVIYDQKQQPKVFGILLKANIYKISF